MSPAFVSLPGNRLLRTAAFLFLLLCIENCQSTYLRNRGRDAADIFSFEINQASYGASVRIGPVLVGGYYKSKNGYAWGMRGGALGRMQTAQLSLLFFGNESFTPYTKRMHRTKKQGEKKNTKEKPSPEKLISIQSFGLKSFLQKKKRRTTKLRSKEYSAYLPFGTRRSASAYESILKDKDVFLPANFYTHIEFSLGLYFGIRIGFNPGELFDFLAGLILLDPFSDDEPFADPLLHQLQKNPAYQKLSSEQKAKFLETYKKGGLPGQM